MHVHEQDDGTLDKGQTTLNFASQEREVSHEEPPPPPKESKPEEEEKAPAAPENAVSQKPKKKGKAGEEGTEPRKPGRKRAKAEGGKRVTPKDAEEGGDGEKRKRKPRKKKERDPNAPKRSQTAYFLWMNEVRDKVRKEHAPDKAASAVMPILSQMWKKMTTEEKKPYVDRALEDRQRYQREKEAYDRSKKEEAKTTGETVEKGEEEVEKEEEEVEEEEEGAQDVEVEVEVDKEENEGAGDPVDEKAAASSHRKRLHQCIEDDEDGTEQEHKEKKGITGWTLTSAATSASDVTLASRSGRFHPVTSAIWAKGEKTPYLWLARTFQAIEKESGRHKIIEILTNMFRSIIALSPSDLLASIYLSLNKLGPDFEGIEIGVGDSLLMKALAEATGRTPASLKAAYEETGDLGCIALASRSTQRTLFAPAKLTVEGVYKTLRTIAMETGSAMQNKKIDRIKLLLVSCRDVEAQYIVRSLTGKLRIGLAEKSVIVALAHAIILTPPGKDPSTGPLRSQAENQLTRAEHILKSVYSEVPSYDIILPPLLEKGIEELPTVCFLKPGIPVKPMLAKPTKGISEVLDRFSNTPFTCEFKYDGERAQIHRTEDGTTSIFSRNSENHTGKYPDLIGMIPDTIADSKVTSFVIDSEVVAFDIEHGKMLPFQILSTRARKNVTLDDIKIKVCVFAFDLLYLNGRSLLREPFRVRREALHTSFCEVPGKFTFARYNQSVDTEDIQLFLNESIEAGCEGLMVKTLEEESTYEPSVRSNKWLKVKKDYLKGMTDSLDLVPIGAFYGKGKRTGVFGAFLLACYDDENEEYQSICKIGTGFSEEVLHTFSSELRNRIIDKPRTYYRIPDTQTPDVWFDASQVWEVLAADLSVSPIYKAAMGQVDPTKGVALRFPRFLRVREDKNPEDASTATQVAEMYRNQTLVQGAKGAESEEGEEY